MGESERKRHKHCGFGLLSLLTYPVPFAQWLPLPSSLLSSLPHHYMGLSAPPAASSPALNGCSTFSKSQKYMALANFFPARTLLCQAFEKLLVETGCIHVVTHD